MSTCVPCMTDKWHEAAERLVSIVREEGARATPSQQCSALPGVLWSLLSEIVSVGFASWRPARQALIFLSESRLHDSQHVGSTKCLQLNDFWVWVFQNTTGVSTSAGGHATLSWGKKVDMGIGLAAVLWTCWKATNPVHSHSTYDLLRKCHLLILSHGNWASSHDF